MHSCFLQQRGSSDFAAGNGGQLLFAELNSIEVFLEGTLFCTEGDENILFAFYSLPSGYFRLWQRQLPSVST
jgi:hypothetical protein